MKFPTTITIGTPPAWANIPVAVTMRVTSCGFDADFKAATDYAQEALVAGHPADARNCHLIARALWALAMEGKP